MVCIWSYGLPFLPGYLSSHRAGSGVPAGQRPSVNLAVYVDGRPASYHLLELQPQRALWDDHTWRFGDSEFRWSPKGVLEARLDLPVPGSTDRMRGSFRIRGVPASASAEAETDPVHSWAPMLGPATGTLLLERGGTTLLEMQGSGYHDRNGSSVAMDRLGLRHWVWTRQVIAGELVITYLNWPSDPTEAPEHVVVRVDAKGQSKVHREVPARVMEPRLAWFGMPWWRRIELDIDGETLSIIFRPPQDDGPFYLRTWTETSWRGQRARGIAELCRPDRIDRGWHRPLVRMCVQHEDHEGSMWLPLFCGPRAGRVGRLFEHWRRPGPAGA